MALRVEVLIPKRLSETARPFLHAITNAARSYGDDVIATEEYVGEAEWLVLYGVGAPERSPIRAAHINKGARAILWDLGYFERRKYTGYLRCSIDKDHPQDWFDKTEPDHHRWDRLGIGLFDLYHKDGPIVLVGLGPKTRIYLNGLEWERQKLVELRQRFPKKQIVYRPKPNNPYLHLPVDFIDATSPITHVLRGASLVVCRHSNVAVDAIVMGVPYEAEDGAAMWLVDKPYTRATRLDFLYRLAWWQWRATEASLAWKFIRKITQ